MRTSIAALVIFALGLLAGAVFRGEHRSAAAGGGEECEVPAPCKPLIHHASGVFLQDWEDDGQLNLTDAVRMLCWLFRDCPPPVQPCQELTGQTRCFSAGGEVIDCGDDEFPGQDGAYRAGCRLEARFEDNGDGTVTDHCTGLMWQKEPDGPYTWQEALKHCENDLDLAEYDDWRAPNIVELHSLLNYGSADGCYEPFPCPAPLQWLWSSTTLEGPAGGSRYAYVILSGGIFNGSYGPISWGTKLGEGANTFGVRAVRGAGCPPPEPEGR